MASVYKRGGKQNRRGFYYISWVEHDGKRRSKCAKTTDKATAQRIAAKLESDAAARRCGLVDPALEGYVFQAKRPLADLVSEYRMKLVAGGVSDRYVAEAVGYVNRFAAAEGVETIGDIEAQRLVSYAASLSEGGRSARTVQASISAVQTFRDAMSIPSPRKRPS